MRLEPRCNRRLAKDKASSAMRAHAEGVESIRGRLALFLIYVSDKLGKPDALCARRGEVLGSPLEVPVGTVREELSPCKMRSLLIELDGYPKL